MRLGAMLAAALVTAAVLTLPAATASAADASWLPKIPHGKGTHCVAPTDWMRRHHMTALFHHRDDVLHEGIETKRFDLTGCIDCHAVKGADGKPVTYASPKHFCRSCHDYAAVQIDCFECHRSTPETKAAATGNAPERSSSTDAAALAHYLGSPKQ